MFVFQWRVLTAPFHHVAFADFWLADQLNSLVVAILDMEYLSCFYALDYYSVQGKKAMPATVTRHILLEHPTFYPILYR